MAYVNSRSALDFDLYASDVSVKSMLLLFAPAVVLLVCVLCCVDDAACVHTLCAGNGAFLKETLLEEATDEELIEV